MARELPLVHAGRDAGERDSPTSSPMVLLEGGFRPFFLGAGLYAVVSIVAWLLVYAGAWDLPTGWVPMWWHGHELVFGFAGAAICGFLLTAVPNWTGTTPVRGGPLAALALIWLAGRVAMWAAGALPAMAVALVDLALFPALAVTIAAPIVRSRNQRNYGFPLLLLALFAANTLTHLQVLGVADTGRTGLWMGLYVVILMVTVVGGRIVPAFTAGALAPRRGDLEVRHGRWVGRIAVAAVAAAAAFQLLEASPAIRGGSALLAAALLVLRSLGWRPLDTLHEPLLWVLHVGHAWLIVGFAALALTHFTGAFPLSTAVHALSAGAIGTMAIAVMTRATLGHSGRELHAPLPLALAFVLVILGGVLRVFPPALEWGSYRAVVIAGGVLWAAGYALFTVQIWPMVTRPRVDGKPG